jgi:hypothetical protein
MNQVKRYDTILVTRCGEGWQELQEEPEGEWIRFEDYASLSAELAQWKTWGVVEVAVRNPSVAEYMKHWEERTEKAESALATARQALEQAQPILAEELQTLCSSYCPPCKEGELYDYSELKEPELTWITETESALDAVDAALARGGQNG